MKYLLGILFCFIAFNKSWSQSKKLHFDTRVTYKAVFIGDSSETSRVFRELNYVFFNDSVVLSESDQNFEKETNQSKTEGRQVMRRSIKGYSRLNWSILKTNQKIVTYDAFSEMKDDIGNVKVKYEEPADIFNWELHDDTATINSFHTQKATLNYGNRLWIAWFSTDIPIATGPYKFQGLPGLIISISDSKNHWHFLLEKIENFPTKIEVAMDYFLDFKSMTKGDFFKGKRYFEKNYLQLQEAAGINFINPENRAIMKNNVEIGFKQSSNWIELKPQ